MEAMSQPQHDRPFTRLIHSKWTRLDVERKPHGQTCTVRFGKCTVRVVSETHFIGGEWTRRVDDELEGQELDVAHPVHGGPIVLRSNSACHDAIRHMLTEVLPAQLIEFHDPDTEDVLQFLDEFVPADLVETIVDFAEGGGSCAFDVSMQVEVTRVYSEAEELLLLCEAAASDVAPSARRSAPGAGDACSICMEDLADGGAMVMPECSHAFHRECILQWFGKAPTCPYCRRDMIATSISDGVCT